MLKVRLIPVLLLQDGMLVRSQDFRLHQIIGNPINEVKRFNEWDVDELIYLDISRGGVYSQRRSDHRSEEMASPLEILSKVSKTCFMPLAVGGRIRSLDDAARRFRNGADKIAVTALAHDNPSEVTRIARLYGEQAVVVGVDVRGGRRGKCFVDGARTPVGACPVDWARRAQDLGAGEILLQDVDRDGAAEGYDLDLIQAVSEAVDIPVICLGGAGRFEDYPKAVKAGASAVAAANLWHFKEHADRGGKRALEGAGVPVRQTVFKRKSKKLRRGQNG